MTTTPVATAATGQPEWARCRGRGEQSLHCAFVAQFPVVGSSKAGKIGLVYGRFSHQIEAQAAMLLAPLPLIMGNIGSLSFTAEPPQLRWSDRTGGSTVVRLGAVWPIANGTRIISHPRQRAPRSCRWTSVVG